MAITFVNKSAFASGTAALTVGAVASVQAGDLILLFVESANENIATPTGYTQVTGSPVSTGTAATAGGVRLAVFYQWATGADTTTSVADSGNHTTAIKMAFRGVDTTTPFDATPVSGIKTPASTSTSFPGITTTTANAWIVHASGLDLDAASTATTGTPTNASLTGLTERHDQTISGGVGGGLVVVTGTKATAGATGNTTATVTSTIQVYLTMALREFVDLTVTITGNSSRTDHTSTTGGITQTHVAAGNSAAQATTATTGAISSTHLLAGNGAAQPTASTTGAVEQITDVTLTGNSARQDTLSTAGAVSSNHTATGNSAWQNTTSTTGAVTSTHLLAGSSAATSHTANTDAIGQAHVMAGASAAQATTATTGAVDLTFTHILSANSAAQPTASTSGAATQTHLMDGASARQNSTATQGAVTSTHILSGASARQDNGTTANTVTSTHVLAGNAVSQPTASTTGTVAVNSLEVTLFAAPVAVDHIASSSAIVQTHLLTGDYVGDGYVTPGYVTYGSVKQVNTSTAGAWFASALSVEPSQFSSAVDAVLPRAYVTTVPPVFAVPAPAPVAVVGVVSTLSTVPGSRPRADVPV